MPHSLLAGMKLADMPLPQSIPVFHRHEKEVRSNGVQPKGYGIPGAGTGKKTQLSKKSQP
jgi:hypothetical protein